jgi:hypothetical protein
MRSLAIALMIASVGLTAAIADDTCSAQANANKLKGADLERFMVNCKTVVQIACEGRAIDQKVANEVKDTFTKQCIKEGVGR